MPPPRLSIDHCRHPALVDWSTGWWSARWDELEAWMADYALNLKSDVKHPPARRRRLSSRATHEAVVKEEPMVTNGRPSEERSTLTTFVYGVMGECPVRTVGECDRVPHVGRRGARAHGRARGRGEDVDERVGVRHRRGGPRRPHRRARRPCGDKRQTATRAERHLRARNRYVSPFNLSRLRVQDGPTRRRDARSRTLSRVSRRSA